MLTEDGFEMTFGTNHLGTDTRPSFCNLSRNEREHGFVNWQYVSLFQRKHIGKEVLSLRRGMI